MSNKIFMTFVGAFQKADGDLSWDFIKVIDCKKVRKGFFFCFCLVGIFTALEIENLQIFLLLLDKNHIEEKTTRNFYDV
jgi:hypothetical protein